MPYRNLIISVILLGCLAFIGYYVYDYYKIPDAPEGDRITDLTYPGIDGNPLSIAALKGNIVLIDFWASWCGPCRYENPHWVQLYNEFHNGSFKNAGGFEIYAISLDYNRQGWLRGIQQDGLNWQYHVSDLKGWKSDAAQRFGVRSIPANILIDEEGKVVDRNLTPAEVKNYLEKRVK